MENIVDLMQAALNFVKSLPNVSDVSSDNDHKSGEVIFTLNNQEYILSVKSV